MARVPRRVRDGPAAPEAVGGHEGPRVIVARPDTSSLSPDPCPRRLPRLLEPRFLLPRPSDFPPRLSSLSLLPPIPILPDGLHPSPPPDSSLPVPQTPQPPLGTHVSSHHPVPPPTTRSCKEPSTDSPVFRSPNSPPSDSQVFFPTNPLPRVLPPRPFDSLPTPHPSPPSLPAPFPGPRVPPPQNKK